MPINSDNHQGIVVFIFKFYIIEEQVGEELKDIVMLFMLDHVDSCEISIENIWEERILWSSNYKHVVWKDVWCMDVWKYIQGLKSCR